MCSFLRLVHCHLEMLDKRSKGVCLQQSVTPDPVLRWDCLLKHSSALMSPEDIYCLSLRFIKSGLEVVALKSLCVSVNEESGVPLCFQTVSHLPYV